MVFLFGTKSQCLELRVSWKTCLDFTEIDPAFVAHFNLRSGVKELIINLQVPGQLMVTPDLLSLMGFVCNLCSPFGRIPSVPAINAL